MKTILVLEDEPTLMSLLRGVLGRHGYDILEAASPEAAIQQFKDSGQQIDLLLADVGVPRISGVQVALLLRSERPDLKVILTSGYPPHAWSVRDAAYLHQLGSESVVILPKPFSPRILLSTIGGLMEAAPSAILRAKAS